METNDRPDLAAALHSLLTDPEIDLRGAARAALGSAVLAGLLGGGLYILGKLADGYAARIAGEQMRQDTASAATDDFGDARIDNDQLDDEAIEAAALLGVNLDATADEIRAALRARLGDSCLHPDQGGDGTEARRVIDAKNLLIERLREVERESQSGTAPI